MTQRRAVRFHRSFAWGALSALGVLVSLPAEAATLSGDAATAFDTKVVADGLSLATDVAVLPDGRVVVIQKPGDVYTYTPGMVDPAMDKIMVDNTHDERGLLGIVIDPNFTANQYVYFYASQGTDANNRQHVLRYKLGADGKLSDLKVLIDMGLMGPANHNGGAIDIYQGNLYLGVGDTGANATPPTNHFGSCLNHANGKVLRISAADGQPVADNPLMNVPMVTSCQNTGDDFTMGAPDKRIWGWGFRNPFRIWMDKTNGHLWVGDVGETTREEITVAQMGKHHGYPFREGTKDWMQAFAPAGECTGMTPSSECIGPVYDYGHDNGNNCVIGGRILDGCGWPDAWKARYIFGDNGSGNIWTLDVNGTRDGVVANSVKQFGNAGGGQLTSFRMGSDNALYIVEKTKVTRVTAKNTTVTAFSCPTVNAESGTPTGGTGAGGAANGGTGGTPAGGGATNNGGTPTGGGTANNGGTPASGGATSTAGSGTGGASAGNSTTAGAAGTNGANSNDSGGCGCHVVGGGAASSLGLGALALTLGAALRRRRARNARS